MHSRRRSSTPMPAAAERLPKNESYWCMYVFIIFCCYRDIVVIYDLNIIYIKREVEIKNKHKTEKNPEYSRMMPLYNNSSCLTRRDACHSYGAGDLASHSSCLCCGCCLGCGGLSLHLAVTLAQVKHLKENSQSLTTLLSSISLCLCVCLYLCLSLSLSLSHTTESIALTHTVYRFSHSK